MPNGGREGTSHTMNPEKEPMWAEGLSMISKTLSELGNEIAGLESEITFLMCEKMPEAAKEDVPEAPASSALNQGLRGAHRHAEELLGAVKSIRDRLEL